MILLLAAFALFGLCMLGWLALLAAGAVVQVRTARRDGRRTAIIALPMSRAFACFIVVPIGLYVDAMLFIGFERSGLRCVPVVSLALEAWCIRHLLREAKTLRAQHELDRAEAPSSCTTGNEPLRVSTKVNLDASTRAICRLFIEWSPLLAMIVCRPKLHEGPAINNYAALALLALGFFYLLRVASVRRHLKRKGHVGFDLYEVHRLWLDYGSLLYRLPHEDQLHSLPEWIGGSQSTLRRLLDAMESGDDPGAAPPPQSPSNPLSR